MTGSVAFSQLKDYLDGQLFSKSVQKSEISHRYHSIYQCTTQVFFCEVGLRGSDSWYGLRSVKQRGDAHTVGFEGIAGRAPTSKMRILASFVCIGTCHGTGIMRDLNSH